MSRQTRSPRGEISSYYDFIRVDSTRRGKISDQLFTDRRNLENIYLFELQLTTISDVHVSTGMKEIEEKDVPEIIMIQYLNNKDGKPTIPGSTFKGLASTNYMALTGSIDLTSELFGSDRNPAISKAFFEDVVPIEDGKMKLVKVKRAWMPRRRVQRSIKFYISQAPPTTAYGLMQCIPKATLLSTTIRGVSLKDFEVGGLLMSLGLNLQNNEVNAGVIKLGYGKPQGFGQLKLVPEKSRILSLDLERLTGLANAIKSKGSLNEAEIVGKYIKKFIEEVKKRDSKRDLGQIFQKIFVGI
ncbi:MAG: RAMP superfamily CRISPR-associated protein [Candidatus Jordarchaeum sp.]|uniref:RAMP superfamily CRISPR-associated protein n=1 Tax=Candidatus Jordarchaeum sp. TaxID=2823881 RepID=UPI00404B7128